MKSFRNMLFIGSWIILCKTSVYLHCLFIHLLTIQKTTSLIIYHGQIVKRKRDFRFIDQRISFCQTTTYLQCFFMHLLAFRETLGLRIYMS